MMMPTLYQKVIIEGLGLDPNEWWPVEWSDTSCTLKNRATQEVKTFGDITGFCEDNVCRNIANDDEDPTHDYVPQITINEGGPRFEQAQEQ